MTEQVHSITDVGTQSHVVPPPPPAPKRPTHDLEKEADNAIRFLQTFANTKTLDPELRMSFVEIQATIRQLKGIVVQLQETGNVNHERIVEMARSQRLIGS